MPPFLTGLRRVLKLSPRNAAPEPHPLEASLESEIESVQKILRAASEDAELEKHNPISETLQVLNLQAHRALATYAEAKGEKDKALVTGVLEKLQVKVAEVKAEAVKLRDAAAKERKQWKEQSPVYNETVKTISQLPGINAPDAGTLGSNLATLEAELEAHRFANAGAQLKTLQPKAKEAFDKAALIFDSTEAVEKLHADYLSRKPSSADPLDEFAARLDELATLDAAIEDWRKKHAGAERETAKAGAKKIDALANTVAVEKQKVRKERDALRKETKEKMLEQIKSANAEDRKKLSADPVFVAKMNRYLPMGALEYAWKQLGMEQPEIEQENQPKIDPSTNGDLDDDLLGPDFREYMKFETTAIEPTNDPGLTRRITIPAGVPWLDEASGSSSRFRSDYTFEIVGTGPGGTIKFEYGQGKFGFVRRTVPMGRGTVILKEVTLQKESGALFSEPPKKDHIKQGAIGDCYLLAALTSLVVKDPGAIEDMMNDKGETVTVRLFDVHTAGDKKEFKPRFFNIEKSVVRDGLGNAYYAKDSLWVQMLEKAYAAGGFTGDVDKQAIAKFENIADGYISHAYSVLTGKDSQMYGHEVDDADRKDFAVTDIDAKGDPKKKTLPWSAQEKSNYRRAGGSTRRLRSLVSWDVFTGNERQIHIWMAYLSGGHIEQLFAREYGGGYSGEVTIPDFVDLFDGRIVQPDGTVATVPGIPSELKAPVLSWIKNNRLYPGKRGTADYSELQLKMYGAIKDALDKGKMVGLGSKEKVGRVQTGTGHSGGEAISAGLVGSHAYTVFEVREDGGLRSLLIRNPWGEKVQRNVTVADRLLELDAIPILQEYDRNEVERERLVEAYEAKDTEKNNARDARQIALIEADMRVLARRWNNLGARQTEIENEESFKERARLKTQDPVELLSFEAQQSSDPGLEGGEFWLPLSDLTLRFSSYHIC